MKCHRLFILISALGIVAAAASNNVNARCMQEQQSDLVALPTNSFEALREDNSEVLSKALREGLITPTTHYHVDLADGSAYQGTLLELAAGFRARSCFTVLLHTEATWQQQAGKSPRKLVLELVRNKMWSSLEELQARGYDINAVFEEKPVTPLCIAANLGEADRIESLVKLGADPLLHHENAIAPIVFALGAEKPDAFNDLLKRGVRLDVRNGDGKPLIFVAVEFPDRLEALLKAGGKELATCQHDGESALTVAVQTPSFRLDTDTIPDRFVDDNAFQVKRRESYERVVMLLLANGADPAFWSPVSDMSALFLACREGISSKVVDALINGGANPNEVDSGRYTALIWTARGNGPDAPRIVDVLASHGVACMARDQDGGTALKYAIEVCDAPLVEASIKLGCDPSAKIIVQGREMTCKEWARRACEHQDMDATDVLDALGR